MRSVLLVDDDVKLCEVLRDHLARHNIELSVGGDGEQALKAAHSGHYHLMLLDVMLPGMGGFEVLQRLRAFSDLYVLLFTEPGKPADCVRGLHMGADDCLPKPFDTEELVARIYAILRRGVPRLTSRLVAVAPASGKSRLQRDGLAIDFASRTVSYGNETIYLTDIELSLLEMFLQSPGVVLTREELVLRVFQRPFHPLDRSLDMYVSRLRRKLRSATPLGNHIKTIRSTGYLFASAEPNSQQI